MSFLLDTDICSAYLRGNGAVTGKILQHGGRLHVSVITMGELYAWAKRAKSPPSRVQDLIRFVQIMQVRELTLPTAERWGELRAAQLDSGTPSPRIDLLIASTALVHGLILVTHNIKDFANIPGLNVVDWLTP